MRDGLMLIRLPTRYGYGLTIVGWIRRTRGDWYEVLPGAVTCWRKGARRIGGLDRLAANGPGDLYGYSNPTVQPEPLLCLVVRRWKVADEEAWRDVCPKPKDWVDGH